jgi:3-oxoacyl-[acyl-carrier-protein] synthase II
MTPLGNSRDELWDGFRNAKSGIRLISCFDPSPFPVRIAGEVRGVDPYEYFQFKERQHVSRSAALAISAARQALEDAKLNPETLTLEERRRIGVLIGSGGGGLEFTERQYGYWYRGEPKKGSVYTIPTSTIGTLSSEISMAFRLHGASHVVSTGCTSSTDALFYACDAVVSGRADMVLTGGVDAPLAPGILAGFLCDENSDRILERSARMRISTIFERPRRVCSRRRRLAVRRRNGSFAKARGARIYAEVRDTARHSDAYHRVRLDESGIEPARAMRTAIEDAELSPADIDYVNVHGTSTQLNDRNRNSGD